MARDVHDIAKEILQKHSLSMLRDSIPLPDLPPRRRHLKRDEQWQSILWMIRTAEREGPRALNGLALAYGRLLHAKAIDSLVLDARPQFSGKADVGGLLWDRQIPLDTHGRTLDHYLVHQRQRPSVQLQDTIVFVHPWQRTRLARALQCMGNDGAWGEWQQSDNHQGIAWFPWPILWVSNGNHSTTAAMLKGGGEFRPQAAFDATPLLTQIRTDGMHWLNGQQAAPIAEVKALEMAAIFMIGRKLIGLDRAEGQKT